MNSRCVLQLLLLLLIGQILTIIITLDGLQNLFHLLGLSGPFFLADLGLTTEKFIIRLAVAPSKAIPQSRELAVVIVEVEMVHGMTGGTIDDGAVGHIFPIVDHDGPEIDEAKQNHVRQLLQGKDEGEDMIRHGLRPAIERVEGVRGKGTRHDPLVVWLVQRLVHERMVQAAMDPVDAKIGEGDEQRELQDTVQGEGFLVE